MVKGEVIGGPGTIGQGFHTILKSQSSSKFGYPNIPLAFYEDVL